MLTNVTNYIITVNCHKVLCSLLLSLLLLLLLLLLLSIIAENDNAAYFDIYVTVAWSVCVSSVTFVHPAKPVGRNEMPFGRDTRVVPSNFVK